MVAASPCPGAIRANSNHIAAISRAWAPLLQDHWRFEQCWFSHINFITTSLLVNFICDYPAPERMPLIQLHHSLYSITAVLSILSWLICLIYPILHNWWSFRRTVGLLANYPSLNRCDFRCVYAWQKTWSYASWRRFYRWKEIYFLAKAFAVI